MDSGSSRGTARATRKRPSPFGSDSSPSPAKWIGLDAHSGTSDVIIYDLENRRTEQGASSGIPSPVDDDKTNDSLDQDMFIGSFDSPDHSYFPLYQSESPFPDLLDPLSSQNAIIFSNEVNSSYDIFGPISASEPSREMQYKKCMLEKEPKMDTLSDAFHLQQSKLSGLELKGLVSHTGDGHACKSANTLTCARSAGRGKKARGRTTITTRNGQSSSARNVNMSSKHWKKAMKTITKGFTMVLDSNLTIVRVSENVVHHLGYCHTEMAGQSLSSFIHPSYCPVVDYIKDSFFTHRGGCLPLDLCHSIPIQLRLGPGKNSGYRNVNWHVGVMRSSCPRLREDGHTSGGGGNNSVVFSVCVPAMPTSSSLIPCRMELAMLRRPRHWMCYNTGENWAFCPFDIDAVCGKGFEITSLPVAIKGLLRHKSCCSVFKILPLSSVTTSVSGPDRRQLTRKRQNGCSFCNCSEKNPIIQPQRMCLPLHKTPKSHKSRDKFQCFFVCLQRNSKSCCERKWTTDERAISMKQKDNPDNIHTLNSHSIQKCKCVNRDLRKTTKVTNLEPSKMCILDNQIMNDDQFFKFNLSTFSSNENDRVNEKGGDNKTHHLRSILLSQSSNDYQAANGQHENLFEKNPRHISDQYQSSEKMEGSLSHLSRPEDNTSSTFTRNLSECLENDENQIDSSSNISEGFSVDGLEEIDLTTEFSFNKGSGDVVMPVESGFDCVNDDIVLTNSPSNNTGVGCDNSNISEQCIDQFSSQISNDYTYSFDSEFQAEGFQTFDHILNFPSSSVIPSSNSSTNHNHTIGSPSCIRNLEFDNDCSNELLLEMDNVVPANKNPFENDFHSPHRPLSTLLQSCNNQHEDSVTKSSNNYDKGRSLLRSLLNKNEDKTPAVSDLRQSRLSPSQKFSRHVSISETCLRSKHALQTKELPVPQSITSKKRRLSMPTTTQELPLPGSALKNAFSSILSPTDTSSSSDVLRNNLTNVLQSDETLTNLINGRNNFPDPNTNAAVENKSAQSNNLVSDNDEDVLPDDLVDLAMEYCNSLDSRQTESLIRELNEQFGCLEHIDSGSTTSLADSVNQTSYSSEIGSALHVLNAEVQSPRFEDAVSHSSKHDQGSLPPSLCLPPSTNIPTITTRQSSSLFGVPDSTSPHSHVSKESHISLLRQAVTSPDVDKLIERIPLGRKIISDKSKCLDQSPSFHIDKIHLASNLVDNSSKISPNLQNTTRHLQTPLEHQAAGRHLNQGRPCISSLNAKSRSEKTTAVSHISISIPPQSPKRVSNSRSHNSSIKLKIPASNDVTNRRRSHSHPIKTSTLCPSSDSSKPPSNPNSSSEGVSVMVMRKENHRSRKNKTIATQTENDPDEVYPALELSPSDVILTPSVYLDTSIPSSQNSLQTSRSPLVTSKNKSASHNCNVFSTSLRYLASPRDSKELMVSTSPSPSNASPSPSSSSTSSLSELELHLRGWSGPDSNLNSPLSSDTSETSSASSDTPFLQRFLTGELSKDKYEKLDKDLLDKQRSSSASRF